MAELSEPESKETGAASEIQDAPRRLTDEPREQIVPRPPLLIGCETVRGPSVECVRPIVPVTPDDVDKCVLLATHGAPNTAQATRK